MFSKVLSSYDISESSSFFLVLECFPEALCVFIFLFVHLCNRDNLSRARTGMSVFCEFLSTPLFGPSQPENTVGEHTKLWVRFFISRRFSFSATLLLCNGIFSSTPTVSQPAGIHISSGSKRKLVVMHRRHPGQCCRQGHREEEFCGRALDLWGGGQGGVCRAGVTDTDHFCWQLFNSYFLPDIS